MRLWGPLISLLFVAALGAQVPQDLEAAARKWISEQKLKPGSIARMAWVSPDRKRATAAAVVGARESDKAVVREARFTEAQLLAQFQALLVCAARESDIGDWAVIQSGLSELGAWGLRGSLPPGMTSSGVEEVSSCAWLLNFEVAGKFDPRARTTVDLAVALGLLKQLCAEQSNLGQAEAAALLRTSASVLDVPEPVNGAGPALRDWKLRHAQQAARLGDKELMGRGFAALMNCKGNWRAPELSCIATAGSKSGVIEASHLLAHWENLAEKTSAGSAILAAATLLQHEAPDGAYFGSMGPGAILIVGLATSKSMAGTKDAARDAALTLVNGVIAGTGSARAELIAPQMEISQIPQGQALTGPFDVEGAPAAEQLTWNIGGLKLATGRAMAWVVARPPNRR